MGHEASLVPFRSEILKSPVCSFVLFPNMIWKAKNKTLGSNEELGRTAEFCTSTKKDGRIAQDYFIPKGCITLIKAVWTFSKETFWRPTPFEPKELEREFLADYAGRFSAHRNAALTLCLAAWVLSIGWDCLHSAQGLNGFLPILGLRFFGVLVLVLTILALKRKYLKTESRINLVLSITISVLYVTILLMMSIIQFPQNYLYCYTSLLLVMIYMFGFLRIRSGAVILTSIFYLLSSLLAFEYAATLDGQYAQFSSYAAFAATVRLVGFSIVGCAIAVELERTARGTFLRERSLKKVNLDLEASQDEMRVKTAALVQVKEDLRVQAERENINKSKFLADAAHDLRQPLQGLSNFLEAAEVYLQNGDFVKCAEFLTQAQIALRLTRSSFRSVLEISKLESGFVQAELSDFNLENLILEVVGHLKGLAEDRRVNIRVRPRAGEAILVRSDRILLSRVIANLVSNAITYSNSEKKSRAAVLVSVIGLPSRARIDIIDNGIGIPRSQWENIFKPFFQIKNQERDRDKGLGLGLSIIRAIMPLLLEHRISMDSQEGRGTRFSIEIPRIEATVLIDEFEEDGPPVSTATLVGKYIIYVEDDMLVHNSTIALFDAKGLLYESFNSFADLKLGLEFLERTPDLIITDHRLPENMTSEDIIRAVVSEFNSKIPTIVLTGELSDLEHRSEQHNSIKILRKPISPQTLLSEISSSLSSGEKVQA